MIKDIPIVTAKYFNGINSVDENARLTPVLAQLNQGVRPVYPLLDALNVDIDNTYSLSTRQGSDLLLAGTDYHSGFGNEYVSLVVDGSVLYRLNFEGGTTWTRTALLSGLTLGATMTYCPVNDKVYMTNGSYIGYYHDGAMYSLTVPDTNFKVPLPAGKIISYHKGSLYVARENVLFISDALCDHWDEETGFRVLLSDIQMIRPVSNGVFVSDSTTTWFIPDDDEDKNRRTKVFDSPAIFGTDVEINGEDVKEGTDATYALWVSKTGICLGLPTGKGVNLTAEKYNISTYGIGSSVIRKVNGIIHYLVTLK